MLFAILCNDIADGLSLRQATRPAHLDYLHGLGDALVFAGPFTDDNGDATGSLVMVRAEDRDAAQKIAKNDPYALAGLFQSVEIKPWVWGVNKPEGM